MTYCYVFNLSPDGIGVISDTRLSSVTTFGDVNYDMAAYQKIYCPAKNTFITFAGMLDHISELLKGLGSYLSTVDARSKFNAFERFVKKRYGELWGCGYFNIQNLPNIALIYGDIRQHRGKAKCRVLKLEFGFHQNKPSIWYNTYNKRQSTAIGWSKEGRKRLNYTAGASLAELESRSLLISAPEKQLLEKLSKIHGSIQENAYVAHMSTSGKRDGSFRTTLRKHCNDLPKLAPQVMRYNPVMIFSGAAQKAIKSEMDNLRREMLEGHETVSDTWALGNLTLRDGFRVSSDEELRVIKNIYESMMTL